MIYSLEDFGQKHNNFASIIMSKPPSCKRIYCLCRWKKTPNLNLKGQKYPEKRDTPILILLFMKGMKYHLKACSGTLRTNHWWFQMSAKPMSRACCLYSSQSLAWVQSKNESQDFWSLGSPYVKPVMHPGILAEIVSYCKTLKPTWKK